MIYTTSTAGMSREKWLEERRKGIGGSDTAALLGLSPYGTPYTVWADKMGLLPAKEETEATRLGKDLEQYVASRFSEISGKRVHRRNCIIRNDRYPWALANIDREIYGENSGLECKTTSALNTKKFQGGEFPANYYTQCVHYLAVTEYSHWYLAVAVLGVGFYVYQLTRAEDDLCHPWCVSSVYIPQAEIDALMDAERQFWHHVEEKSPPDFQGKESETKALGSIYAQESAECADLSEFSSLLGEITAKKAAVDALQKEIAYGEQRLKEKMKGCEFGEAPGFFVTWKSASRSNFDLPRFCREHPKVDVGPYYKTTYFRTFRIKEDQR